MIISKLLKGFRVFKSPLKLNLINFGHDKDIFDILRDDVTWWWYTQTMFYRTRLRPQVDPPHI